MEEKRMDQADGLRRLFRAAPPDVLAVLPCGAVTTRWVADQVLTRVHAGRHMLVLDEWEACGNLADCLHASMRFDLLQAIEGQVSEAQCIVDVMPGLRLAQVGRLARVLGAERIARQRTFALLQSFQASCDEWLLLARPGEVESLSPLLLAAPRLALVVDAHPMSVTAAWASLKRVVRAAPDMGFALCHAGKADASLQATLNSFCSLAASRLGVQIVQAGNLSEVLDSGVDGNGDPGANFLQSLLQTCRTPAVKTFDARFPGTLARMGLNLP